MTSPSSEIPKPAPPKPLCYTTHEESKGRTHFCTKSENHGMNHLCPCGNRWGAGT